MQKSRLIDLKGKQFNYLKVLSRDSAVSTGEAYWICECHCGIIKSISSSDLRKGKTKSCGCMRTHPSTTHGMSNSSEYKIYKGMIQRCTNKNKTEYRYYGGRGITVCDTWKGSFEKFLEDMGLRPNPSYSLDRMDSNGPYSKENCRWATPDEQWENRKQISLTVNKYQFQTAKTAIYPKEDKILAISYCLLGLAGEAGEVCGKFKKVMRDGGFDITSKVRKEISAEIGDVAWYISQLCTELGLSLDTVLRNNLSKLEKRKAAGTICGSGDVR